MNRPQCEHLNVRWGVRCWHRANAVLYNPLRKSRHLHRMRVCGTHRLMLLRAGWQEGDDS